MSIGTALFFLLILACPLMMIFMMRGHGGHEHRDVSASVDELRRQRDELDREIAAREGADLHDDGWRSSPALLSPADAERGTHETNHGRALARR
jgi:hypothetical protein